LSLKDYKDETDLLVDNLEQKVKNEIDLRIEIFKGQLEEARNEMHVKVKNECEKFKRYFLVLTYWLFFNIKMLNVILKVNIEHIQI